VFYVNRDLLKDLHVSNPGADSVINASNYLDYRLTYRDSARRFEPSDPNPIALSATRAMLAMFTGLGMTYVESRVLMLTDMLCEGLEKKGYRVHSPRAGKAKSGIVTFSPTAGDVDGISARLTEALVIHTARYGTIRLSPHFYNTEAEIERVLNLL
jgi:selenocysteine lyase/cysteine desulfurase